MSFNSTRSRLSSIRRASNTLIHQNNNRRDRLIRLAYSTNNQSSSSSSSSKQDKQDDNLPAGVSPWARFMDVLKSEYAKSQEIQVSHQSIQKKKAWIKTKIESRANIGKCPRVNGNSTGNQRLRGSTKDEEGLHRHAPRESDQGEPAVSADGEDLEQYG
jgi:hypothetical protein